VGRVSLYDLSGSFETSLPDPAPLTGARFGESVSFMPDATGDTVADLVIGADAQDFAIGDFAGAVFLFSASGASPSGISKFRQLVRRSGHSCSPLPIWTP